MIFWGSWGSLGGPPHKKNESNRYENNCKHSWLRLGLTQKFHCWVVRSNSFLSCKWTSGWGMGPTQVVEEFQRQPCKLIGSHCCSHNWSGRKKITIFYQFWSGKKELTNRHFPFLICRKSKFQLNVRFMMVELNNLIQWISWVQMNTMNWQNQVQTTHEAERKAAHSDVGWILRPIFFY